ncbi:LytTR family DNA-binding domain-containing protein [Microbulbifer sp. S227A]|uniref:LytTR family DNA-binding domain-containing protein n=1 Tax=Microbulbifer sp. S227A TaxID=3415131 RepID=UPI003C7A46B5
MIKVVKEFWLPLTRRFNISILLLVSFLGAIMGPFGTYETHSFLHRLFYWSSVSAASILIGGACYRMTRHYVDDAHPVVQDLTMIALTVFCFSPPLWFLTRQLAVRDPSLGPTLLKMGYYVAAITLCICALRRIIPGMEPVSYLRAEAEDQPERPRLGRRLSAGFEGPILRLSVRDHFVDVISASAVETIRMRFADAIDEMDTVVGFTTHRSHWVARDAIVDGGRDGGKLYLVLTNGDQVPVSRKYRPALEEAGVVRF